MTRLRRLWGDERGATIIEFAFAFPVLIVFVYMIAQLGFLFRANAGIQHALGEGAREATLWPTKTKAQIKTRIQNSVWTYSPGTFTVADPVEAVADGSTYYDLSVTYEQKTSLIMFPGPTVKVTKTKRVWVAS